MNKMYKELIKKLETKYFFYREPTDNEIYNFLGKLKTIKSHFGYISDNMVDECVEKYIPYASLNLNEAEHMNYERLLIAELSEIIDGL